MCSKKWGELGSSDEATPDAVVIEDSRVRSSGFRACFILTVGVGVGRREAKGCCE